MTRKELKAASEMMEILNPKMINNPDTHWMNDKLTPINDPKLNNQLASLLLFIRNHSKGEYIVLHHTYRELLEKFLTMLYEGKQI